MEDQTQKQDVKRLNQSAQNASQDDENDDDDEMMMENNIVGLQGLLLFKKPS